MAERVVTATEARVRFGELMRRVVEEQETVIVERAGKQQVVVLSVAEYEHLRTARRKEDWRQVLQQAIELGDRIRARRGGRPLPPAEEVIREMREERGEQLEQLVDLSRR